MTEGRPAPRPKRGEGRGGRFFLVYASHWEALWTIPTVNRLHLVLTFLTLSAGTGADNRHTAWSANAVTKYTGIRHDAACTAIDELQAGELLGRAENWEPRKPHYLLAAPAQSDSLARPMFLPVQLVTGLGTATPILRRLREAGDALAVRLLLDLYAATAVDETFAVSPAVLRTIPATPAELVIQCGAHAIWRLSAPRDTYAEKLDLSRYMAGGDGREDVAQRVGLLSQLGATRREAWLFSGSEADDSPILPWTAELAEFAEAAARDLLAGRDAELAWRSKAEGGPLVVLPAHHKAPALVELTVLTVQADTPARRAAYGAQERLIAHWLAEFERLAGEAVRGDYSNPLKTQVCRHQGNQGHQGYQGHQVQAER